MNENRLTDYLHHMEQAATDACGFVEGLAKEDFLEDKRTQQAVIMSLIIIAAPALLASQIILLCSRFKLGCLVQHYGNIVTAGRLAVNDRKHYI